MYNKIQNQKLFDIINPTKKQKLIYNLIIIIIIIII